MAKGGSNNNMTGRRSSSSHTPKPYDANNSFVKKVATKVTDLIPQRSWISKWFNTSQGNGDVLDDTENAEDVESEEDVQQPPPAKKPRIRMDVTHPPGTFSIQPRVKSSLNKEDSAKMEYNDMSEDFTEPAPAGPSGIGRLISSTPAVEPDVRHVATRRSELNSLVTTSNNGNINGTDDNSESSESTSGCSSLIPQTNRQEAPTNASYSSPFSNKKRFMDEKLNFTNHLQSPRSLFLESNARDSLSNRRPSFNASVMTNTLDRASPLSSPFYSGNTTFGGASAAGLYKRGRGLFNNTNEPQLKIPRRTNVEVKPSNATGVDSSGMSQTAKKILEALEHFSSPISDAKKIPLKNLNNTITPSPSKKRQRDEVSLPSARVGLRHITRELTVPTVADILKLKRRQKLQDTTVAARKIVSARNEAPPQPPQEYHIRTEADEGTKHHGKLRAKAKVNIEEEETVETVNLPSIPLPISSLPNFNFVTPLNPITTNQKVPKKEEAFTFASPIKVTSATKSLKSINNFTFSSPVRADGKPALDNANDTCAPRKTTSEFIAPMASTTTKPAQNFMWSGSSTAPRPKKKVIKDQETPAAVGLGAAPELKTGSVMDILGAKPNNASASSAEKPKIGAKKDSKGSATCTENIKDNASGGTIASTSFASATSSMVWECSECLIKNNISKSECFVCKAAKPNQKNDSVLDTCKSDSANEWKPAASDSFGSQFKLSGNQWECTSCCVRNKQSDAKCVACTTPKPASKGDSGSSTAKLTTPDLSTKIKPAEDTWECFGCKMKNSKNATTCSYCTTAKPEPLKLAAPAVNKTKDGEGSSIAQKDNIKSISSPAPQNPSTGFADKFKPNTMDSWECPCCLVRNASSADSCPCCTTAKPSATTAVAKKAQPLPVNGFGNKFKKPEGSWTCDACMVQNEAKTTKCVACTTAKPGTSEESAKKDDASAASVPTFGVPASSGPFKFGIDKTDQKSEGVACTNGFKFGVNKTSETSQFKFGVPKEANKDSTKNEATGFGASKPLGTGFVFQPSTTTNAEKSTASQDSEKPEKKPCFSFGVPKSENTASTAVSTEKQNPIASVSATPSVPSVPSFTFGVPKSDVKEMTVNNKKPDAGVSAPTTQSTAPTLFTTANTNILATAPAVQNNSQEVKPSTGFQFGVPSGTTTSNSGAATSTTTAATLPSSVQSSFTFSATKPVAQQASLPTFAQISAPTPATTMSSTFILGENKTTETTANLLNKNPLALPSEPAKPIFPNVSNTPSLFGNTERKPPPAFAAEENKQTNFGAEAAKPAATFGLSENKVPAFGSTENKPSLFGSSETKLPVFGATDKPTPVFNPTPQATPAVAPPAFGSSTASTPLFGSSSSVFQNNTPSAFGTGTTPSIFPTTKAETNTAASSNLFTFGTTPGQPAPPQGPGFSFSESTNRTGATQEPLFTFGNNANTAQNNNLFGSNTFNNPAQPNTGGFTFNAPKMETPTFGQSTSGPTLFGAAENNAQSQPAPSFASAPSSSTGFNFGQSAPTTSAGGFNFSAMASNPAPSGGFNFNPPRTTSTGGFNFNPPSATPTFDPNAPPSFNFTGGTVPPFNARPQPCPPRKIKKAIRRRN